MANFDKNNTTQEIKNFVTKFNNVKLFDEFNGEIILGKNSDYDFKFNLNIDYDQFEIYAVLRKDSNKEIHSNFWRMPLELVAYKNDLNEASKHLMELIEIFSTCHTKIVQKKGLLFYSFYLIYWRENAWHKLKYNYSCFRYSSFVVPNRSEKEVVYYSNRPFEYGIL